jgi:hypothetical protein
MTIDHDPIGPPSFLVMTITAGRGGAPSLKSGQRVDGVSKVEPLPSPGCWMARNSVRSSGVKIGPQTSAPLGAAKNCRVSARPSPATSQA